MQMILNFTPEGNLTHFNERSFAIYNCIIKVNLSISILDDAIIAYYVLLKTWKG